ncbi:MAG: hypothetical protein GTO02_23045, partial [Candidatus Dadabacteria bacterium]|nr:hypothetical protein [Candidatus Dadabacteria bacterium]
DIEEVKETIRKADKAYEAQRKKRHEETLKELQGACGLSGKEPTLSYDDELSDACQPDLEKARYNCAFNREVDV